MPHSSTFRRRCGTDPLLAVELFANAPVLSTGAFTFERPQPERNLNSGFFTFHRLGVLFLSSHTMSLRHIQSVIRLSHFAVVAALFGLWFISEQGCQASCGDYLAHHDTQKQAADGSSRPHDMPKTPCRGANCSRRPDAPPAPTRPTVETTSVEWLCAMEQIRDQDDESTRWSLESVPLTARHTSQLLDRPPRG